MIRHPFTPSRPDGTVCVKERRIALIAFPDTEVCGHPPDHPIHAATPAEAHTGVSDRAAAALTALASVRREVNRCIEHGVIGPGYRGHLDIIEAALREGGAR